MERIKRNERVAAMARILSAAPSRIYTLGTFCQMFDAAKSTISEDVELLRQVFRQFDLGDIDSVAGAAGGVKFVPRTHMDKALAFVQEVCNQLSDPSRILPGGMFYMQDLLSMPDTVERLGTLLALPFVRNEPDFVLTVETKGITVAMMAARALRVPLVIARRDFKAFEGPIVTINYLSGSTGRMQTMSLARRAVKEGQKALIVDDFMKAGGTLRGMTDIMREFCITVVGTAVLISTKTPEKKRVENVRSLIVLGDLDEDRGSVDVSPAPWLVSAAQNAQRE